MICPNCENKIPDKAKVCGYCGYKLKAGATSTYVRAEEIRQGQPGWVWGLVGGLVTILITATIGVLFLLRNNAAAKPQTATPPPSPIPLTLTENSVPTSPTSAASRCSTSAFLEKPFIGTFPILNYFDHEYPTQERNGSMVTWWGERSVSIGYDGHPGTDWEMPEGTPLLAAADGWIRSAGSEVEQECFGSPPCPPDAAPCTTVVERVVVDTRFDGRDGAWEGYLISYYHLSRIDVFENQFVHTGDSIGLSGQTGCASSPHLHFQISWSDKDGNWSPVDPYGWTGNADIPLDPWAASPSGAISCYLWSTEP